MFFSVPEAFEIISRASDSIFTFSLNGTKREMMTNLIHKLTVQRLASALLGVTIAGAVAALSGCATAPPPKETRLVWPEPPEKARIEFIRSIVSDEDLTKDTTATQSLLKFL